MPTTARASGPGRGRVGRPRAQGPAADGLAPRDGVLAAAAELFTRHGYAATTTRAIAERAGLRQASMYHYFAGKEDILAALLEGTVQPSLDLALVLAARTEPGPEARLWALCRADVALLCGGPHNLGALYLLPEVAAERFTAFHRVRAELKAAYRGLLAAGAAGAALSGAELELRGDLLFGLIEGVILIRREAPSGPADALASAAADAALRVSGASEAVVSEAAVQGAHVLEALQLA
ncbi:TetR/AcrR family transcriptional regulator [Streptacidiphilus carbonis]|jgi:AcrR family transcriptional regulator|uniref:TetR/AcrR family transcriptional regulator n=1 Tax=Streptacidiphilus carbonis TaxID=105422 RepID=UPI0005A8CB38|nr:TetR/AcrR family transcriptional regulator [Streptacidiphilus carbonis]